MKSNKSGNTIGNYYHCQYGAEAISKYHAIKTEVDGIVFDSKKEAKRYSELKILERAGLISNLRLQVPFVLVESSKWGRPVKYIADFVYEEDGKEIIEDTKGVKTSVYKIKKRLFEEKYGKEIKES